jgi:hypothetical protein
VNEGTQIDGQPRSEKFWSCEQTHSNLWSALQRKILGLRTKPLKLTVSRATKDFRSANKATQIDKSAAQRKL